ncbi:MAG: sigma-70 family RNA polymerase sigma factor [Microcella sp.]|uniref:RNA polymerase sigma factor n=1 Tax=Microcella sp. TaxID=1913979 RepID=UPI0033150BFB
MTERDTRMRTLADEIVEPVRRYLHRRTDPATADDVLGEVLLTCWRRLDDVPAEALPWAIVVARNCLANAERTARRQNRVIGKIIALDPPHAHTVHPGMLGAGDPDDDVEALHAALARLRAADAELLRLWAWDQLSNPQLATVLGISANAVAIRLHRAKTRLREELAKDHAPAGHVRHEEGRTDD